MNLDPNEMLNSFLEDIEAEEHDELLRIGVPKRKPCCDWNDANSWKVLGQVARVNVILCNECGSESFSLMGIFQHEETPSGAKREKALALPFYPPSGENPPIEEQVFLVKQCPHCLPKFGFRHQKVNQPE